MGTNKRAYLLNQDGDALDGFYVQFISLPSNGELGRAVYDDSMYSTNSFRDQINFRIENDRIIAWQTSSISSYLDPFVMIPLRENDAILGLTVEYSNGHVAFFAIENEEPEPVVLIAECLCIDK